MTVSPHPPYTPHFYIFPNLEVTLKGRKFNDIYIIIAAHHRTHLLSFKQCA